MSSRLLLLAAAAALAMATAGDAAPRKPLVLNGGQQQQLQSGDTLTDGSGNPYGGGTLTSVGLSLPSIFTVSGSPVTTSGTLAATLANQSANTVFAGPSSGAATAPAFRALVAADLAFLGTFATQNYASPPAIGATTPNTGAFTTLTGSTLGLSGSGSTTAPAVGIGGSSGIGLYSPGANELGFVTNGSSGAAVCLNSQQSLVFGNVPTACTSPTGGNQFLQIYGTTGNAGLYFSRWQANALGPILTIAKSRSATVGSYVALQNLDVVGQFTFNGDDGSEITATAASIVVKVTGTPSTGKMPAEMLFSTTNTAGTTTTALTLDASQNATFASEILYPALPTGTAATYACFTASGELISSSTAC